MGNVSAFRCLNASRCSFVRGVSSTFGGSGRNEKMDGTGDVEVDIGGVEAAVKGVSVAVGGVSLDDPSGVGTLEMLAGVAVAEGRGLFLDRGRDDGADKKSSGMSFHCSVVLGIGVVLEGARFIGIRGGAEVDFGGGGGRFGSIETDGGCDGECDGGWEFSLLAAGFFSHPDKEDCSIVVDDVCVARDRTSCNNLWFLRQQ